MDTLGIRGRVRAHPLAVTVSVSVLGYSLVIGTFLDAFPASIYPTLTLAEVNLLTDAIAVINTVNVAVIAMGWWFIRTDRVRLHAVSMITSFVLICIFLVLYLTKIGGGGTKEFVGPELVYFGYLALLAIHITLSIVAVPVVLFALVLGLTHTPIELREQTPHRRVGRIAASAWLLSLVLGVVTYLLLNHVYTWEYVG
jgi:Predicted membrane protein